MKYFGDLNLNQTSETLKVEVLCHEDHLTLIVNSQTHQEDQWFFNDLKAQAPFKGAPFIIYHRDGRRLMIEDYDNSLITTVTKKGSQILYLFETNKKLIIGSAISLIGFIWVFYAFLLPAASNIIAKKLSPSHKESIEKLLIKQIVDSRSFLKSQLTEEQKNEVKEFLLSQTSQEFKNVNILFRRTTNDMANAFALSYRTIILTDEIFKILSKNELLAVYFHELGHLKKEHVLKRTIRATSLAILASLLIGDLTGGAESLATLAATLIGLSFDRKLELEADQYSLILLNEHRISPLCFPDSLTKIEKHFENKMKIKGSTKSWTKYFQTHPQNEERRERFDKEENQSPCHNEPWKTLYESTTEDSVLKEIDSLIEKDNNQFKKK